MFQKENGLPFIHGAKKSEWHVNSWLAISNMHKIIAIFHEQWYSFSQWWKSLKSTLVYVINNNENTPLLHLDPTWSAW